MTRRRTVTAADYGQAAIELEMLRRLVEQRCSTVRFVGYRVDGSHRGEYTFRLGPDPGIAIVRAPVTPTGRRRHRDVFPGCWQVRFIRSVKTKIDSAPWRAAQSVDQVVEMVCAASQF